jgi:hypothetical protein
LNATRINLGGNLAVYMFTEFFLTAALGAGIVTGGDAQSNVEKQKR